MVKNAPANAGAAGDAGSLLGQEGPWRRNGSLLQGSCLGIPTDRGARQRATVHGDAKSWDTVKHAWSIRERNE